MLSSITFQKKNNMIAIATAAGLIVFVAIFLGTQMILTQVYGLDLLNASGKASLGLGLSIPISNDVDAYVEHIKAEICPTLNNETAEDECHKL